jgi:nitrate/nitrite transport system permease protein
MAARGTELPTPWAVFDVSWEFLSDPLYDAGPNDKGIGILLAYSMGRLAAGFICASVCAILLGVLLGRNPALFAALNAEGRTVVLITHDATVAAQTGRVLRIHDGRVV